MEITSTRSVPELAIGSEYPAWHGSGHHDVRILLGYATGMPRAIDGAVALHLIGHHRHGLKMSKTYRKSIYSVLMRRQESKDKWYISQENTYSLHHS